MARTLLILLTIAVMCGVAFIAAGPHTQRATTLDDIASTGTDMTCTTCVAKVLSSIATRDGAPRALTLLITYYDVHPENRKQCNFIAREVASTTAYTVHDFHSVALSQESGMCDYGFLHQFPRTLLAKTEDPRQAAAFCAFAGSALAGKVPLAAGECFRGLGQDLPFLGSGDIAIGPSLNQAAERCKTLTSVRDEYLHCLDGASFALGHALRTHEHGLALDPSDPLGICGHFDEDVASSCKDNLLKDSILWYADEHQSEPLTRQLAGLQAEFPHLSTLQSPELMWVLAYEHVRLSMGSPHPGDDIAMECGSLSPGLRALCVRGYAFGLAKHGTPYRQHEAIIGLCTAAASALGTDVARCVGTGYGYLKGMYSPARFKDACTALEASTGLRCDALTLPAAA